MNDVIENAPVTDDQLDLSIVPGNGVQSAPVSVAVKPAIVESELMQPISDLTPVFQKVEEQTGKVQALKKLEGQVSQSGSIDLVRAVVVNESFGDLFGSCAKAGFTSVPTKSNFRETCGYMQGVVAKEEAVLVDLFKTYVDEPYKGAQAVLEAIATTVYPGLVYITESLISELGTTKDQIFSSNNATVTYDQGHFVNLVKDNLLAIDPDKINSNLGSLHTFRESISTVQAVFKCPVVSLYIFKRLNRPHDENEISLADLTAFLLDTSLLSDLASRVEQTSTNFSNLHALVDKARALDGKPEAITEFVTTNSRTILDLHKEISELLSLLYYLTFLNTAIKQMLVTYYEM